MTRASKPRPELPKELYLSLQTGEIAKVPSFEGWTSGDVAQWKSEHQRYVKPEAAEQAPWWRLPSLFFLPPRFPMDAYADVFADRNLNTPYAESPRRTLSPEERLTEAGYAKVNAARSKAEQNGVPWVWPQTRQTWALQVGRIFAVDLPADAIEKAGERAEPGMRIYDIVHEGLVAFFQAKDPSSEPDMIRSAMHTFLQRKDLP